MVSVLSRFSAGYLLPLTKSVRKAQSRAGQQINLLGISAILAAHIKSTNMIVQSLLGEFMHEAENTRKLLQCIPDSALGYKPSEKSWTTAQLASHIAEIYNWYPSTLLEPVFDMSTYKYDKGDISKIANIIAKFEENMALAKSALEKSTDAGMAEEWKMVMGDKELLPPMPRIQIARGFLMNHLYHHRGEMIVYLRATGNKVPSIYGPTADDQMMGN